ncbi:plant intracellular ras-group-related lrr protein 9 [Gigaspora margarita]|uniref:Plant intracellular ras-group-related lrr protein 9 n=1 Tax=Gigaspora margarita TaxID=4874 RepID=A0A8H3X2E2_GIGMA|nr:plant intracellular ras-group-related lrr protein 9 [Gigaspora margarita]
MVDANQYINSNYPFPSVNRTIIQTLDVSNRNLINTINLGPSENFTNLVNLNTSFNQISGFTLGLLPQFQNMDFSHNILTNFIMKNTLLLPRLSIINLSHNSLSDIGPGSVILTHLDISNNLITTLDLSDCRNLVKLNCSGNRDLSNLTLNPLFNPTDPNAFDCRGTSIGQVNTTSYTYDCRTGNRIQRATSTSKATVTVTNPAIQENNNNGLYLGIGIGVGGIVLIIILSIVGYLIYKRRPKKGIIKIAGGQYYE